MIQSNQRRSNCFTPALLRRLALTLVLLLTSGVANAEKVCGAKIKVKSPNIERLETFAKKNGLRYEQVFAKVAIYVNVKGHLPKCYVDKGKARDLGWRPGTNLWDVAPGRSIGGNRFGNFEGRLPKKHNGKYVEADLDFDGRRRGANRLVFVRNQPKKWLMWITTDHYKSFTKVPAS